MVSGTRGPPSYWLIASLIGVLGQWERPGPRPVRGPQEEGAESRGTLCRGSVRATRQVTTSSTPLLLGIIPGHLGVTEALTSVLRVFYCCRAHQAAPADGPLKAVQIHRGIVLGREIGDKEAPRAVRMACVFHK